METPVLSKKQQQKSLSSKKVTLKSVRNVLVQPYEKYWPLVDDVDEDLIINKLKEYLTPFKRHKFEMPYLEMKNFTKDELKLKRQIFYEETNKPFRDILKSVVFGINAVTRQMEKGVPICVLLSSRIDPSILTSHICTLSSLKRIPLLIMSNLEDTLQNTIGFKAITLAFTNDNDYFKDVYSVVLEISKKFPITVKHANYDNLSCEDMPVCKDIKETVSDTETVKKPQVVLLTRLSNKTRAFIPKKSHQTQNEETNCIGDFISINTKPPQEIVKKEKENTDMEVDILNFSVDTKPSIANTHKYNVHRNKQIKRNLTEKYIPLKVKRIQGNPKKIKNKKFKSTQKSGK